MGPCCIGTMARHDPGNVVHSMVRWNRVHSHLHDLTIDRGMSQEERTRREAENARRIKARSLYTRMSTLVQPTSPGPEPPDTPNLPNTDVFTCPRYEDIIRYLFGNRVDELALDTMDFPMPEPTLLRYITRHGFEITPVEFRDCHQEKKLFR